MLIEDYIKLNSLDFEKLIKDFSNNNSDFANESIAASNRQQIVALNEARRRFFDFC